MTRNWLSYVLVLTFFGLAMGSPVPGFLLLLLIGLYAWVSSLWMQRKSAPMGASSSTLHWTTTDTTVALSVMSVVLFKMLSTLWSNDASLAWSNVAWHLYFLFWPLIFMGVQRCSATLAQLDKSLAWGLIVAAVWHTGFALTQWSWLDHNSNLGILAQIVLFMGGWNLLALTRPQAKRRQVLLSLGALLATLVLLLLSTRRIELLGFCALFVLICAYRLRGRLPPWQWWLVLVALCAVAVGLLYLRSEKLLLGYEEAVNYWLRRSTDTTVVYLSPNSPSGLSSLGPRLEMWRTGWLAFMDHPFLGLGADARPFNMQIYGAPVSELFKHRHFHSHLMQVLVEGGLLGILVFITTLGYWIQKTIVEPWRQQRELALLSMGLVLSYAIEGTVSAAFVYDKPNALFVMVSAWIWVQLRSSAAEQKPPAQTP